MFWGDAVLTAVYLINLTPTKALKCSKTTFGMWYDSKPQIKYSKYLAQTKFDDKSWKCILLGYEPNGCKVWNPECEKHVVDVSVWTRL